LSAGADGENNPELLTLFEIAFRRSDDDELLSDSAGSQDFSRSESDSGIGSGGGSDGSENSF